MQKAYRGQRTESAVAVTVNWRPLDPRRDLRNHSPDGFNWGYAGSGPAQLALAILADHFGNDELALTFYQDFKFRVIAGLREDQWTLTDKDVTAALQIICNHDDAGPGHERVSLS